MIENNEDVFLEVNEDLCEDLKPLEIKRCYSGPILGNS